MSDYGPSASSAMAPAPSALVLPQPKTNGFAVTAVVLGVVGVILGLVPLLSLIALVLGAVGVVFGLLAVSGACKGRSSKAMSAIGLCLSLVAVGLSIWGLSIVSNSARQLARDLRAIGPAPVVSATIAAPSAEAGPSSAQAPPSSPQTPAAPAQSPDYSPTGAYDVTANTGSTLQFATYDAQGQISLSNWIRSAKATTAYTSPPAGKRWAAVKVQIKNTGSTPLPFNVLGFILIDKNGYRYTSGGIFGEITAGPQLSSGDLAPGEKTTGFVVTEVPTNTSIMEMKMNGIYGNGSWALK